MCNEMQVTLQGQPRISVDKEELLNKWNELSNYQIGTVGIVAWVQISNHNTTDFVDRFIELQTCLCAERFVGGITFVERTTKARR